MKLTWDNLDAHDDGDALEKLCKISKPKDFYFDVFDEDELCVMVCPKPYYDKYNYWFDQHLMVEHLLPSYLQDQVMESTFAVGDTSKTKQDVITDMIALGFMWNGTKAKDVEAFDTVPTSNKSKSSCDNKNCGDCVCDLPVNSVSNEVKEEVQQVVEKPEIPKFYIKDILGLSEDATMEIIKKCKYRARIICKDDNWYIISNDLTEKRINLILKRGVVVKAYEG